MKLIKLILIMAATNAVSEWSAFALQKETYLHITMHQDHINHLMILQIHKYTVDKLPLGKHVNEFILINAHRSNSIAKFWLTAFMILGIAYLYLFIKYKLI